jgi:hypothetical protein
LLKADDSFLLGGLHADKPGPSEWTIDDIEARCVSLADLFIRAWPAPRVHTVNPRAHSIVHTNSKASSECVPLTTGLDATYVELLTETPSMVENIG